MELSRIKTALSRLMRKKWVWFLLVIAGFWTASHVWDYYKLLSGQTPMYDVAIKLKVGDELVEINRTVPCLEIPRGEPLQYIFKKRPFTYRARDLSTGAHLENGRAVHSIIPDVCREIKDAMKAGETGNIAPADFLPMTALMDDFDDPQLMKVFGARSYYARDDAEVKVLSYDIRPAEKGSFPSLKDDFGWFRGGTVFKRSNDYLFFDSARLVCLPIDEFKGQWTGNARAFDGVAVPVYAFDVQGFDYPFRRPFPGVGMPFTGDVAQNIPAVTNPDFFALRDSELFHISLDYVIPAVKTKGIYQFNQKDTGVLLLQRAKDQTDGKDVTQHDDITTTTKRFGINVEGQVIDLITETIKDGSVRSVKRGPYFFSPTANKLCFFGVEHIRFLDSR